MNIHHKKCSQKVSATVDRDDFKKKLEKSVGSLKFGITEFSGATMQQRIHKSIYLNYFCFFVLFPPLQSRSRLIRFIDNSQEFRTKVIFR